MVECYGSLLYFRYLRSRQFHKSEEDMDPRQLREAALYYHREPKPGRDFGDAD